MKSGKKDMKKFVMSNTEYKKNSQWNGTNGHNNRLFAVNKNSFPQFTKNNFGSPNLNKNYQDIHKRHQENLKKKLTGKENTFLEIVVGFSLEQFEQLEKELSKEELQQKLTDCMNGYLNSLKVNFGFEPVGFTFHLDEGVLDEETGVLKRNVHAHAIAYNYDFKRKVAPLRSMTKRDFADMQDLVAANFISLGFERGISKELTKKNHLEKDAFVAQIQKEKEQELLKKDQEIALKNQDIKRLKAIEKRQKSIIENQEKSIETNKKKITFLTDKIVQMASAMPKLFGAIFALDTPKVKHWSAVVAGLIPSKSIKNEVIESLDSVAEYSHEYATEICDMVDFAKEKIEIGYQEKQDQKKKKSPGLTR